MKPSSGAEGKSDARGNGGPHRCDCGDDLRCGPCACAACGIDPAEATWSHGPCVRRDYESLRPGGYGEGGLVGLIDPCGVAGLGVTLRTCEGRDDVTAGPYCPEHGGGKLALDEARRDWAYLAPPSVRGVTAAGCEALSTDCHVVVIRREESGRFTAGLGVGSCTHPVRRQEGRDPERSRESRKSGGRGHSWSSADEALAAGLAALREHRAARVAEIRTARGGTLDWGVPVQADVDPIVLGPLTAGEKAWDALVRHPRYRCDCVSGLPVVATAEHGR